MQVGQWRKNHVKGMADKDLEKAVAEAGGQPMRLQTRVELAGEGEEDGTVKKKTKRLTTTISLGQARSALRQADTL